MTEIGNPQKPTTGIPDSLGKRTERVSHIPTATLTAAKLSCSNPISERTFLAISFSSFRLIFGLEKTLAL
jgi:hypothetical protein